MKSFRVGTKVSAKSNYKSGPCKITRVSWLQSGPAPAAGYLESESEDEDLSFCHSLISVFKIKVLFFFLKVTLSSKNWAHT